MGLFWRGCELLEFLRVSTQPSSQSYLVLRLARWRTSSSQSSQALSLPTFPCTSCFWCLSGVNHLPGNASLLQPYLPGPSSLNWWEPSPCLPSRHLSRPLQLEHLPDDCVHSRRRSRASMFHIFQEDGRDWCRWCQQVSDEKECKAPRPHSAAKNLEAKLCKDAQVTQDQRSKGLLIEGM